MKIKTINQLTETNDVIDKYSICADKNGNTSRFSLANIVNPIYRVIDNKLQASYDAGVTFEPASDYIASYFRWSSDNKIQMSNDNSTWTDLSDEFTNNVFIKGYVDTASKLPSDASIGSIYMVGTGAPYEMYVKTSNGWVNNGSFTSVTAGIVNETGNSEHLVMSQKSVTDKLTELESEVSSLELINIVYGLPTKGGYYDAYNTFIENESFIAVENVPINSGCIYAYTGDMFSGLCLIFLDSNGTMVGTIGGKYPTIPMIKSESYIRDGVAHYTSVVFKAPRNATKIQVSSWLEKDIMFGLYEISSNISRYDIETEFVYLGKSIYKENLISGFFWDAKEGIGTKLKYGHNELAMCSSKLKVKEGNALYVKSCGNNVAPPLVWLDENDVIVEIPSIGIVDGTFVAPKNVAFVCLNVYPLDSCDFEARFILEAQEKYLKPKWTIPNKIYAVKGQEKSIYLDNIVNRNDDAPNYVIEVNKSFGNVDSRRFYFTPDSVGTKSLSLNAWDSDNKLVDSKLVSIEVIDNVVPSLKRVVCIGDSITEGQGQGDTNTNIPHHIKNGIDKYVSSGANNIVFVGSKGTTVRHEGWWGRTYQWLANTQKSDILSPFVNPATDLLDIHYYRTQKCNLAESEYIDVVSLAMGFNGSNTEDNANLAFSSMQAIIAAFKADNPNTKFIVHLVTYPAMGNVNQPNEEQRNDKKNSLYYFRTLCMDAYNNNQDPNIFIGDLGLGYDRWYAYIRKTEHPASYYEEDDVQVVTDRVHPSWRGAKQMAENMIASIVKAAQ